MIGKSFKVNDYKFTYGQGTIFVNMYAAFKYLENGNKYAIYSYEDDNKLYYGAFFQRANEAVIMSSKEDPNSVVKEFIDLLLQGQDSNKFEILSLDGIESIQVIEEYTMSDKIDINTLYNLTIPKPVVEEEQIVSKSPKSIATFFFVIFIVVVISFFIANPEVINGENKGYSCSKSYSHSNLPASVNEVVSIVFDGRKNVINLEVTTDYVFNDIDYYVEFKDRSYFYKYMEEGDTYKFVDENYTYRVFSVVDTENNFFLPTSEFDLISHYKNNNYTCKEVELNEE